MNPQSKQRALKSDCENNLLSYVNNLRKCRGIKEGIKATQPTPIHTHTQKNQNKNPEDRVQQSCYIVRESLHSPNPASVISKNILQ